MLLLLYFDSCYLFLPFFIWGCCFSNINVSKRVSSIQLVVTWCTLQQHSSMHLTTSRMTSTGMLESLSSIFLSLTWSWWKLVHYYLTLLYPDYLQVYCWLWLDYWAQLCHLWTHAQWCICHRVWRGNKFELETLWSSFICIMHGRASENESNWHVISGTKKTNSTISSYF